MYKFLSCRTYDVDEHYQAMKKAGVLAKMPEFN